MKTFIQKHFFGWSLTFLMTVIFSQVFLKQESFAIARFVASFL